MRYLLSCLWLLKARLGFLDVLFLSRLGSEIEISEFFHFVKFLCGYYGLGD